ncbi:Uncharacterized protein dnm_019740 [Desulfonema magnum]|uniref:Uncharacterized protein n=1 Tax=Desulfonema magnum TaxID=45655 RepID=A0A975BI62_9BACT|nr:Uncharacterized protein dnm_019740 [Desulfonema magnum]
MARRVSAKDIRGQCQTVSLALRKFISKIQKNSEFDPELSRAI